VPLAVPLLAGPGAIGTTIIAAQAGGIAHNSVLVLCIALVCALLWVVLRLAPAIADRMGTTGLNIATRLLGLLLAAIAIQTMAEGLKQLLPGLA
jgi:multiple antibiotic resistance protein